MRTALALFVGFLIIFTGGRMLSPVLASAMTIGVQDQGADPNVVARTAQDMGATTVRMVVRTDDPQTELVRTYRSLGLQVQAAILVKRTTTPAQVLATVRAWNGQVRTVSVGNEPELNGVPACAYMRLVSRTAPRSKRMGLTVGFGEFSPVKAFEYIQQLGRCHVRIRADFTAVHPYQFFSDPLGAPTEHSGVGTWLGLGNLGRFRKVLGRALVPRRLRITEFNYLVTGRYKIPMARATDMIPRAVKQARKYADQFIWYGLGCVHGDSNWGSAPFLDCDGRRTPAYLALARALGRTLSPELVPVAPAVAEVLPDGTEHKPLVDVAPVVVAPSPVGEGAKVVEPTPVVVPDPMPSEPPVDLAPVVPVPDPSQEVPNVP